MQYVLINNSLKEISSEQKISLNQQLIFAGSEAQFPNRCSVKQNSEAFCQNWNSFCQISSSGSSCKRFDTKKKTKS